MAASSTTKAPSPPSDASGRSSADVPADGTGVATPLRGLGRYLAQPKHWFSPTSTPPAHPPDFTVPFDVDPRADHDGVARWLADILRALADTSRDASDPDERAARLEAVGVQANALLSRWRDAAPPDASASSPSPSASGARSSRRPGPGPGPGPAPDDPDEEASLERDARSRAVASAVKDLLRSASRTDDRGFRRAEERPPVDDAGSGGAVSRLCAAVQSALDHRARRTLGRRVSDALGLDRLRAPAAVDAHKTTTVHQNKPKDPNRPDVESTTKAPPPEHRHSSSSSSSAAALEAFERRRVDRSRSMAREMSFATTPAGRARAWIHGGLNRGDLAERIAALAETRDIVHAGRGGYYDAGALLADETAAARVVGALRGLTALPFALPTGNACDAIAVAVAEAEAEAVADAEKKTDATETATETSDARSSPGGSSPPPPPSPSPSPSAAVRSSAAALLRFRGRLRADARWGASASARLEAIAPPNALANFEESEREEDEEEEEEEEREGDNDEPTKTTKTTKTNGSMSIDDGAASAIVSDALEAVDEAEAASPAIVPAAGVGSGVRTSSAKSPAPDPEAARARWGEHLRGLFGAAGGAATIPGCAGKPAGKDTAVAGSRPARGASSASVLASSLDVSEGAVGRARRAVADGVGALGAGAASGIQTGAATVGAGIQTVADGVASGLQTGVAGVSAGVSAIGAGVAEGIQNGARAGVQGIQTIGDGLGNIAVGTGRVAAESARGLTPWIVASARDDDADELLSDMRAVLLEEEHTALVGFEATRATNANGAAQT